MSGRDRHRCIPEPGQLGAEPAGATANLEDPRIGQIETPGELDRGIRPPDHEGIVLAEPPLPVPAIPKVLLLAE
jgi:hypothetical protein